MVTLAAIIDDLVAAKIAPALTNRSDQTREFFLRPHGNRMPVYLPAVIFCDGIDKSNGGRALVIHKVPPAVGDHIGCSDLCAPFQYDHRDYLFPLNRIWDAEGNAFGNRIMPADDLIHLIGINVAPGSDDYFFADRQDKDCREHPNVLSRRYVTSHLESFPA